MIVRRRTAAPGAPTIVAWHVQAQIVADCVPVEWGIQTDTDGAYTSIDVGALRALANGGPLVLAGWSAGCQAVRAALVAGVEPAGVLALDGTAGSMPPAPWQIDVWRTALARGRAGEACVVITATQQTYVEALPVGQRFASTLRVVSAAWGASGMLDVGTYQDASALVEVHASKRIDADAHVREVQEHGPRLLRGIIVPWVDATRSTEPPPPPSAPPPSTTGRAAAALAAAQAELAAGVREQPSGSNTSLRIRQYLAPCVRGGRLLALSAAPWCAAFASWCLWGQDAAKARQWAATARAGLPPVGYRASVAELVADARASGAWRESGQGQPRPGCLLVMRRSGGDPRLGGTGHVEVIESASGGQYWTIGGNVGDRVSKALRSDAVDVVGWIDVQG